MGDYMKNYLRAALFILIASISISLVPNVAMASTAPTTRITGNVWPPRDDPYDVAGLKVGVTCLDYFTGQYYGYGTDIVEADGSYLITLPMKDCPEGSRLLGGAGDEGPLHYGHGRNYWPTFVNSKLVIYIGDIGML